MSDGAFKFSSVELAAELTIAWLGNSNTRASAEDVPAFLNRMHEAVDALSGSGGAAEEPGEPAPEYTPAVSIRKSVASRDHIISLIDGKSYRTLTRHLTKHGLDPKSYRERYGLKSDYPMTAPGYSEARREMAKRIGLGRKSGQGAETQEVLANPPKQTRGRRKAAAPSVSESPQAAAPENAPASAAKQTRSRRKSTAPAAADS